MEGSECGHARSTPRKCKFVVAERGSPHVLDFDTDRLRLGVSLISTSPSFGFG
jgi:hypothetical protein